MSPQKCSSPLLWGLWMWQWMLFQERTGSLQVKGSGTSPLPLGWVFLGVERARLRFVCLAQTGWWGRVQRLPLPNAECRAMSQWVPIGWKNVDKQKQICIYTQCVQPARAPDIGRWPEALADRLPRAGSGTERNLLDREQQQRGTL